MVRHQEVLYLAEGYPWVALCLAEGYPVAVLEGEKVAPEELREVVVVVKVV